ncbi:MAG: endo-1,4-beta-xylanase [Oscillospiraceae bacterium]|jgi:GH35 family endo-1,4-beta-xylanase|nr:endo-1,4-beta-xylanase [Oscillospiraceae bacterium]
MKGELVFGCGAFDAVPLASGELGEKEQAFYEERMGKWLELFEFGTLPFYWGRFEPERGKPKTDELMKAARYLGKKGVKVKGHPLCWHTSTAQWLMELSDEDILGAQLDRIRREVTDFKGVIDMWDVINEVVIMPVFDKYDNGVTRICKMLGRVKLVKKVFEAAREANPGATLLINDFIVSDQYQILIDGCLNAGVEIDVIGIQSHQHQGYWGLEKLGEVLDRFAVFGKPIHFTENTLVSGELVPGWIKDLNDWKVEEWASTEEGEERQARELVEMVKVLKEHPLVEAFTIWDHTDGKWLGAPSGVLRKDNSEKPAHQALKRIIYDK